MGNTIDSRLLKEFGLNSYWYGEDRDEVMRYNKELLEKWKKENKYPKNVEDIPGFLDSLEQFHLYGDSLIDIGTRLGLSGEKVRQLFEKYNLQRNEDKGAMYRIWSDKKNCFVPVSTEDRNNILRETKRKRRVENLEKRLEEIRQTHIKAIQDFTGEYGRAPTLMELGKLLGYTPKATARAIARYWGYSSIDENNNTTYKEAMDNLYNAAGFKERRHRGQILVTRESDTIGARLTKKRLELGLSLRDAADGLGLAFLTINKNELNLNTPRNDTLEKYSGFYDVSEEWILTGED